MPKSSSKDSLLGIFLSIEHDKKNVSTIGFFSYKAQFTERA